MGFGNSGRPVHVEVHGVPLRLKRWSGSHPEFKLTAQAHTDEDHHEVSGVFHGHRKGWSDEPEPFQPKSRGDWTKEEIQRALAETIERSSRVKSEDVIAITDVEIVERRAFITQPWEDSHVQMGEQGIIPPEEYTGPDPEEYRDG